MFFTSHAYTKYFLANDVFSNLNYLVMSDHMFCVCL